jgi:hypothetical protein
MMEFGMLLLFQRDIPSYSQVVIIHWRIVMAMIAWATGSLQMTVVNSKTVVGTKL